MCTVYFTKSMKVNKQEMTSLYRCKNDDARQIRVCRAKSGTKIAVFDDPEYRAWKDDWAEISVVRDMGGHCEAILDFEGRSQSDNFITLDFKRKNGLSGKVSSFTVIPGTNYISMPISFKLLYFSIKLPFFRNTNRSSYYSYFIRMLDLVSKWLPETTS